MFTYSPRIFQVPDERAAKRIILTPEGRSTDERWETETPLLVDVASRFIACEPNRPILDYGCGIGRMSKALIERFGCNVIGVDISPEMRQLAINYVDSPLFSVRSREEFLQLTRSGLRVAGALSIWVLQHCQTPSVDIEIIGNALRPGARLFVVNNTHRAVPVEERHWVNDGIDVRAALDTELTCTDAGTFSAEEIGEVLAPSTFWATYEAKQRE